ncbi:hypothetical protein D3C79_771400 [compost metagenome]
MHVQGVRILPLVTQPVLIMAQQAWLDVGQRGVEIGLAAEQLRGVAAILAALFDKATGGQYRHDQGPGSVRVLLDEGPGAAQHLFRMIGPDRLAGGQGKALRLFDGARRPGLTDAETIDASGLQVSQHLRGWHHDAVDVM